MDTTKLLAELPTDPITLSSFARMLDVNTTELHIVAERLPGVVISRRYNHFYIGRKPVPQKKNHPPLVIVKLLLNGEELDRAQIVNRIHLSGKAKSLDEIERS